MNTAELREKSVDQLQQELMKQLSAQFKLRIQKNTKQLTQTHLLKESRRNIARIRTLLKQKADA